MTFTKKFEEFHAKNPQVYHELLSLARQAVHRGRKKIGIKMLFEVVRWNRTIGTTDPDFKLNNNYHSQYARLLMQENPELAGLFETRKVGY